MPRWNPGSYQWIRHWYSVRFGSANFACKREWKRASVFLPAHFSRHSAIQCSASARRLFCQPTTRINVCFRL